jgi:TolB-like protein
MSHHTSLSSFPFSDEAIFYQLKRIFLHPDFSRSEILRKFLLFIVHETLIGNTHNLKEYTIAVNVLGRPASFNPQKNCIVRIHAKRLRHALSQYYTDQVTDDQIIIGIPKGKYVPVFTHRKQWDDKVKLNEIYAGAGLSSHNEPVTFSILPFTCICEDDTLKAFADSLCLQISASLMQVKKIFVLAYQAVKNLAEKYIDLKEFGSLVGFNHIITGGIYYIKGKIRITIQIVECRSYRQIWSDVFTCKASSNLFHIQDQICKHLIREVTNLVS